MEETRTTSPIEEMLKTYSHDRIQKALQLLEAVERLQSWIDTDPSERGVTVSFSCKSGDGTNTFPTRAKTHNGDFIKNRNIHCEDVNPVEAIIKLSEGLGGR
jgi:hypothetical protein